MSERSRLNIPTNEEFMQIKAAIEKAKAEGDGMEYAGKVVDLTSLIARLINAEHGSSHGDLAYSYQEWAHCAFVEVVNKRPEVQGLLSQGRNFEFRSNTLTNQRTPHLPGFGGNTHLTSNEMANAVGGSVTFWGRPYMEVYISLGKGEPAYRGGDRSSYSAYQVLTRLLGFQ